MALKSSDEPTISFIASTAAEPLLSQYSSGNNIIFDVSIGFIVSAMFYFIVVFLPEKARKENIKKNIGKVVSFILESFSGNPFHWSKHVIHCKPLSEYTSSLNELKDIAKNRKLNALKIKVVVESAHEILPTYEQLTPGALQLSPEHAILWLSLTNSIRQISTLYPCGEEESQNKDLGILDLNLLEFIEYTEQWVNLKS